MNSGKFNDFERQKIISLALFAGLVAGIIGGGVTVLSLTSLNLPGLQSLSDELLSSPTTRRDKIVLEESSAVIDAVKKVRPSVVSITTSRNIQDFFSGEILEQTGGVITFILTSDGLIVTNKHVVSDPRATYTVIAADGKSYQAEVKSTDPFNDLADLKIDAKRLKPVEL